MATLELYLIRHGVAAERGEDYPDDSKRPLTSDGIVRLRKEAKAHGLQRRIEGPDITGRRVLVHASGFRQSPYADTRPPGLDPRSGRGAPVDAVPPRKLWHASPGSSGH